jgi:ABC-type transport system substrate-binding protein
MSFDVVDRPSDLAPGDGVLYVSTLESPPQLPSLPEGDVATFSLAEDYLDDTDPAHAWPIPFRANLEHATGAQLLTYPDAPAPRGSQLVPDAAVAMPHVSADGRSYTFHIRPGFRFSPPSNQKVTAETFKYSIERALSPGLGPEAPGFGFLGDVMGASAFHAGKADHVAGISVRGNRLRIRLVSAAGDFLARLSTPFFAAVPIGTPIVKGGVQDPISSAGPYYLKVRWRDDLVVLERNPNYHGPRPHRLQRIVYDMGNSARRIADHVTSGAADYSADLLQESAFVAGGPLDRRYGDARVGSPRLVQTPQLGFRYLSFNTSRGPFVDARLRRAVNYAIDRRALARVLGDLPRSGYVPPGIISASRSSVYPLSPNIARANKLLHGFRGTVVLWTCQSPDCTTSARIVRANLDAVGLSVRIRQFEDPFTESQKAGASYDMRLTTWYYDWPDPYEVLNILLDGKGFRPDWAPAPLSIPASYRRALEHAALLRGPARANAYRQLAARLERNVAPFAAYSTPVLPELFSARIGCRVAQPVIASVDIGALCTKK